MTYGGGNSGDTGGVVILLTSNVASHHFPISSDFLPKYCQKIGTEDGRTINGYGSRSVILVFRSSPRPAAAASATPAVAVEHVRGRRLVRKTNTPNIIFLRSIKGNEAHCTCLPGTSDLLRCCTSSENKVRHRSVSFFLFSFFCLRAGSVRVCTHSCAGTENDAVPPCLFSPSQPPSLFAGRLT